jgi:hypothetical protein
MRGCVSIPDDTLNINEKDKIIAEYQIVDKHLQNLKSEDEKVVRDTFDALAHITFIPWLNKQNQANKFYFARKGGIKLCVNWMKNAENIETRASAGTAVWNFSESGPMHEILWQQGAVDSLIDFLSSEHKLLQKVAVGALFGLLDYDSNKGAHLTTRNKSIISLLIEATQQYPSWSFRLAKIGCLLSLAKHAFTREELRKRGGLTIFQTKEDDILLQYLNRLGLCHLLAEGNCATDEMRSSLDIIKQQFQITPRNIRDKESEHGVVWSSVRHTLRLLKSDIPIVSTFGLFCLANMSFGDYNRKLMVDQNVIGATICFLWKESDHDCVYDRYSKDYIRIIISNFQNSANQRTNISMVPSLVEIIRFQVYHKYTHLKEAMMEIEENF